MSDKQFSKPNITISKVYTRTGDAGKTRLVGGQQVPKNELRIRAYGDVDELNAVVGQCRVMVLQNTVDCPDLHPLGDSLKKIQNELFNLGSHLATLPADIHPSMPQITDTHVTWLENEIDRCNADLSTLQSFVLPGGSLLNTQFHLARTVCRRAERLCVALQQQEELDPVTLRYLNRLSDALFVWSRWVVQKMGDEESLWTPE